MKSLWRPIICGVFAASVATSAFAQSGDYPTGPVTVIVPLAAGGSSDIAVRTIAEALSEKWGQPVLVDNRPGGGTIIGINMVAEAEPNGQTLGSFGTTFMINPAVRSSLPYDTLNDLTVLGLFMDAPVGLVAHPDFPASTVSELIDEAKKSDSADPLKYATPGLGSGSHMGAELFQKMADVPLGHVPYSGTGEAIVDVLSGRVPLFFTPIAGIQPYLDTGEMKLLAVLGPERLESHPDVPTVGETLEGFAAGAFAGMIAPAGTPKDIVDRISADLKEIVESEEFAQLGEKAGFIPWSATSEEATKIVSETVEQWIPIAREQGITVD